MNQHIIACDDHPDYKPEEDTTPPYLCIFCSILWHNDQARRHELARQAQYRIDSNTLKQYSRRLQKGGRMTLQEVGQLIRWAKLGIESQQKVRR